MDGNGRWGKKRNRGRNFGHLNGVKTVKKVVESSIKLNIPIITFYVFSTENWKRPKTEINFLFSLIINYFKQELKNVISNGIKINIIGQINKLPKKIKSNKIINENLIQKNLFTNNLPNPDILIRTGGHKRLSNFMLWQLAYSEIYFLDKLWPDFNGRDLKKIIKNFKNIKRNFGSV